MPRIVVRRDGQDRHAVYRGSVLLLNGLETREAKTFAEFFRASDRAAGGTSGRSASPSARSEARRTGVTA